MAKPVSTIYLAAMADGDNNDYPFTIIYVIKYSMNHLFVAYNAQTQPVSYFHVAGDFLQGRGFYCSICCGQTEEVCPFLFQQSFGCGLDTSMLNLLAPFSEILPERPVWFSFALLNNSDVY